MKTDPQDKPKPNFEQALSQLETLVTEMEGGRLALEDSLNKFAEGMALAEFCATKLSEAEKKVEILLKKSDTSPVWGDFALTAGASTGDEAEST